MNTSGTHASFSDIPQPPLHVPDGNDIPPLQDPDTEVPARLPEDNDIPPAQVPGLPDEGELPRDE